MDQTQRTRMTQKSILQEIQRQLLTLVMRIKEMSRTLATDICNKNVGVTGPLRSLQRRWILGLTVVLQLVVVIIIHL